ncbi:hypothetical protein CUJ83_12265 [Methanocella sp. CWC-04]|uniref:Serine aminopeptidase S33 domain-containing protein n=1 Tax=Methanooceanicella nereidis TaxID=2052831 RepID=A0AAP2REB4_9EURY|nr:DUF3887 domain-containing protein [Methanocella sp. CWC-04]MCD1295773.1 hypothetical protein [Methanocella sp. CWC-04]
MNSLTIEDLKQHAIEFVTALVKNDFASAVSRFDDVLKNALPQDKLKDYWNTLNSQAGSIQQITGISTAEMQGYRIVFVTCKFGWANMDVQVVFNDSGLISGINFLPANDISSTTSTYKPPEYADQSAFREYEINVDTGEWTLPGTITMPVGDGPFPGVVLVHGSGPNDRDETLGPNKPFKDLAWGLASQGVAVLRYEKRTKAHPEKFKAVYGQNCTVKEEVIDDALSSIRILREYPNVDPDRVFLLGHSIGGSIVPRIGKHDTGLAGLIIMAGSTIPMEDSALAQVTYIYSLSGQLTEQQKADIELLKKQVEKAKDPGLSADTPSSELPLGIPAMYLMDLHRYHPAEVAKGLSLRMLILQGGRDYQVTPEVDFEGWKAALAGKENVTLKLYPELNHLFFAGEGRSTPQEYDIEGHVDAEVVHDIARWIIKG